MSVLLPAPLGPRSPNRPGSIASDTSCSARTPPGYVLERWEIVSTGPGKGPPPYGAPTRTCCVAWPWCDPKPELVITSDDLRFFAVVARSDSVAAAARQLGVTPSAAGQRLAALERRVGVRLADRDRRGLRLTDEGRLLADRATVLVAEFDDLDDALAARREDVGGHLHVVASLGFGRRHVAPLAARFRERYPAVTLDLTLTADRVPSAAYDLWVHIGELRDTALVGRRLAPNDRWLVAAPAYLADAGTPAAPADLVDHAPPRAPRERGGHVALAVHARRPGGRCARHARASRRTTARCCGPGPSTASA